VLTDLGFSPKLEGFKSARSIFQPHLLAASIMLLSFAVYPLMGRGSALLAAALAFGALISDLLELSFRDNPFRRILPKGDSQNVVGIAPAREQARQDIILIGHVDTQRTPIVFSSDRWVGAYKAFTTIAFVAFALQGVLYLLGAITLWPWVWPVSLIGVVAAVLLIAMCVQADRTPFTAGANDNATGAGLVLALAERLCRQPLRFSRVWLACTGCEEVQHYGAIDFFRRHRQELVAPKVIAFEMLGCAGPSWLTKEGIVVPFHADRALVALAEELARSHPEWRAHPTTIQGGNTEMADALQIGIPAITLTGLTPKGDAPYWHQVGDTADKIDPAILARAFAFVWAYLESLDQRSRAAKQS
jgi:Peptidase family M28